MGATTAQTSAAVSRTAGREGTGTTAGHGRGGSGRSPTCDPGLGGDAGNTGPLAEERRHTPRRKPREPRAPSGGARAAQMDAGAERTAAELIRKRVLQTPPIHVSSKA